MKTTAITPAPSVAGQSVATDLPDLSRTTSRATSTFKEFKANAAREPFVLKRKPRASDNVPTESVLDFKRGEYILQRPIYIASYVAGWMVGSPELGIQTIKNVEKGVLKVTGIAPDPIGRRREAKAEKNRLAAKAELDALEEAAEENAQAASASYAEPTQEAIPASATKDTHPNY